MKKSSRRSNKITIPIDRIIGDLMNVQVIDPRAYVFPCVARVEAADDSSMFDGKIENSRVGSIDVNISDVSGMVRLR